MAQDFGGAGFTPPENKLSFIPFDPTDPDDVDALERDAAKQVIMWGATPVGILTPDAEGVVNLVGATKIEGETLEKVNATVLKMFKTFHESTELNKELAEEEAEKAEKTEKGADLGERISKSDPSEEESAVQNFLFWVIWMANFK